MKKIIGLVLVIMLVTTVTPFTATFAMEENMPADTGATAPDTTTAPETEIEDTAKIEERIAKRKEAVKTKLTAAQQTRIKARCKAAQTVITKVAEKATTAKTTRTEVYTNIQTKLAALRDKLKTEGKDTTKLDASIAELKVLVDTFNTDLKELRQVAADLSAMDCTTSPVGFNASVVALRAARDTVVADSTAIRTYIKDNLKPVLQEIRTALGEKKEEVN